MTRRPGVSWVFAGWIAGLLTGLAPSGAASPASASAADIDARRAEAAYRFSLGKLQAEQGTEEQARESFLTALELDASDPYTHLALAELDASLADGARAREARFRYLEEAASFASAALDRAPDNSDVLRVYGRVHFSLAENRVSALRKARDAFERLHEQHHDDLQVLVSLGQIELWNRDFPAAAEVLRQAATYRPDNPMIAGMLLDALLGSEAWAEAAPLLAARVAARPEVVEQRVQLAEIYSRIGAWHKAAATLEAAPQALLADPRYQRRLAAALHRSGRDEEALPLVETLLRGAEEDAELIRLRVSILSAMTRYEDALAALDAWQPSDADALRQRALVRSRMMERLGRAEDASASLEAQLVSHDDLQVALGLAGVLERSGQVAKAAEHLSARLAGAAPGDLVLIARALAELYLRADQPRRAVKVYTQAIGMLSSPENQAAARHLSVRRLGALVADHAWPEVIAAAAPLIDADDADTLFAARMSLARAQAETGELDQALATLDAARTAVPQAGRQLTARRVQLLFRFGRSEDAEAAIRDTAASGTAEDLLFAAQLWQQEERWDASLALLERAVVEAPESTTALFAQAVALERSGRFTRAAEAFESLLRLAPDDAPALNYLGYMWADRGENLKRALGMIQRAVALDPDNGAYLDSLGWVYYQSGDFASARRYLEWAARLIGDDATVHEHLGDVYLALEQPARARDSYRQALERSGGDGEKLQEKLDQLDSATEDSDKQGL